MRIVAVGWNELSLRATAEQDHREHRSHELHGRALQDPFGKTLSLK
jgi:hypothetical protein